MELEIHRELRERIRSDQRDMALITAPGMGLSTLLRSLGESGDALVVRLDAETIKRYWEVEFKARSRGRWRVVHAATITGLIESNVVTVSPPPEKLFKTNLNAFLCDAGFGPGHEITTFVVIDDFDELPDDLALVVCREMKALADLRTQEQYRSLRHIRFVIGGAIDFLTLFAGETKSGVSPATNFCKCRAHEFLLCPEESATLLEIRFPELSRFPPSILQLIVDWAAGYLHYLLEFARWILSEAKMTADVSIQGLVTRLKETVEEQDKIALFDYCHSAWDSVRTDDSLVAPLICAISAGYVTDSSGRGRKLSGLGLLMENPRVRNIFYPPNKLVEIFLRQRLAEHGAVLPIADSATWAIPSLNARAYELILEIENRLRNFIGDRLFAEYQNDWLDVGLGSVQSSEGQLVLTKTLERLQQEQRSIYTAPELADPFLTFLDFGDLRLIVEQKNTIFPAAFAEKLPAFLEELNYHRRRIAHNRPMTPDQIEALTGRWGIIQRMMTRRQ